MSGKSIDGLRRQFNERLCAASGGTFYATIESVDEKTRTCTVAIEGVTFDEVMLYAVADDKLKGFCFIPKTDSTVLVSRIAGSNMMFVVMFSQVDKVLLSVGEKVEASIDGEGLSYKNDKVELTITGDKVELKADEIVFNGGENYGLVKVEQLQKNLDSLKQYVEAIHAALPSAFSAVGAAMLSNGATGGTAYTTAMAGKSVVLENMENEKIKH